MKAYDGGPVDRDGDGFLGKGDFLADRDQNGTVQSGGGADNFDYRTAAEKADTAGAQWTDCSVSLSYANNGGPGYPDDVGATFTFEVPEPGDFDYGQQHYVNLFAGDIEGDRQMTVDGVPEVLIGSPGPNGLITVTYAPVPWSMMTDGEVVVEAVMPKERYVAFDYFLLDTEAHAPPPPPPEGYVIPEPAGAGALALLMLGLYRRRRRR